MPLIGDDDVLELEYMARLKALLARHGLPVEYGMDRAAIDTGLHLFLTGGPAREVGQTRVWFQGKSKRASALESAAFHAAQSVSVRVKVEHLRYWYAAPEPVYLVVYVESADMFVAEDARNIVDRQWPRGTFYSAVPETQDTVTLSIGADQVLDDARVARMLNHRSMRIDGPAFRGRPLGHRFDPLRSRISTPEPATFTRLVRALLDAHNFRVEEAVVVSEDLNVIRGRLYQTLEWQSPAFAEYGHDPNDDFRDEPDIESIHGPVTVVLDSSVERQELDEQSRAALRQALTLGEPWLEHPGRVLIAFDAPDLSGTGGEWRSFTRELVNPRAEPQSWPSHLGLEALSSLLLVATLVYLDFAPEITWDHVNYR